MNGNPRNKVDPPKAWIIRIAKDFTDTFGNKSYTASVSFALRGVQQYELAERIREVSEKGYTITFMGPEGVHNAEEPVYRS